MPKAAGTSVFCGEVANGLVAIGHEVTIAVVNPQLSDCYPIDPRVKLISIDSLFKTNDQRPAFAKATASGKATADKTAVKLTTRLRQGFCLRQGYGRQDGGQANDQRLTTNDYSLIHIHALWSPSLHKISKWAHENKIPVVWSPHGMITPWAMNNKKWKKLFGWWLYQRWDLARAVLLHATAESEVEDVRRMGLKNKVVVAPLGVRIDGRVEHVERVDGKKVLLFVSRVQRKKGLVNLARAWADLPRDIREGWKVRIVGPDQENHTAELQSLCAELGVASDFEFVGPKYGNELQHEYADADLFVLPTYSENFGSVVIESLAHGVPVITTKGTPWHELEGYTNSQLTTHNSQLKCGWWIDIGVEPLVSTLKEAMSLSDEARKKIGVRGKMLVEEKYTWNAVVATLIDAYENALRTND